MLVLLAVAPLAAPLTETVEGPGLTLVISASEVANLVYQLDCAAGVDGCVRDAFQPFWDDTLVTDDDDRAAIAQWGELNDAYDGEIQVAEDDGPASPLVLPRKRVRTAEKLRRAALQADDIDGYCANVALVAHGADAPRFCAIVRRFAPRFAEWWDGEAAAALAPLAHDLVALVSRPEALDTLGRAMRFYGHDEAQLGIDLVLQPRPSHTPMTRARVMEDRAVAEVVPGLSTEARAGQVVHELCHWLATSIPVARRAEVATAFAAVPDPNAMVAYALMGEGIPAAIGNGLFVRAVSSPEAFQEELDRGLYADEMVARVAAAGVLVMDGWMAGGGTLFDPGFAESWVHAVGEALGADATHGDAVFQRVTVAVSDAGMPEAQACLRAMRSRDARLQSPAEVFETGTTHPYESLLLFVDGPKDPLLRAWSPLLGQEAIRAVRRSNEPGVYLHRRTPASWLAVVRGSEAGVGERAGTLLAGSALVEGWVALP